MIFNKKNFNREINWLKSLRTNRPELNPLLKEQIKLKLLSKLGETKFEKSRYITHERGINNMLSNVYSKYVVAAVLAIVLVGGTAYASNDARPGDNLFPLKKATEKVQLALSASAKSKAEMHARIAEQRLEDIAKVSAEHKTEAQTEAKVELATAIEVLTDIQAKLVARGNTTAADALATNIARLKTMAADQNFQIKIDIDQEDHDVKVEVKMRGHSDTDMDQDENEDHDQDDQDQGENHQDGQLEVELD